MTVRLGVISDTHSVLPASAAEALSGVDRIIHAGDVGSLDVMRELNAIAPVVAVRGNVDTADAADLPAEVFMDVAGERVYVTHRPEDARRRVPVEATVVIVGHTHRADVREAAGVTYVNPGSASRPRGGRPTIALLTLGDGPAKACIKPL